MPTDEERRKVAAEMREYPAELTATLHPAEEALAYYVLDLMSIVGLEDGQVMGFFARLADLIEPEPERTCHNLGTYGGFECSMCGFKEEQLSEMECEPQDWCFCPSCGAKVVEQ